MIHFETFKNYRHFKMLKEMNTIFRTTFKRDKSQKPYTKQICLYKNTPTFIRQKYIMDKGKANSK